MVDAFACCEIECEHLSGRLLVDCEKEHCPYAWQRRREEDAVERECKIRIEEEEGGLTMDKCELCGRDWGLLGIVTKADTGEVVTACGPCSEEELRKDLERRLLRVGNQKATEKRRGKAA